MASLMENLIDILEKENEEYVTLTEISKEKTPIIIKGDLEALNVITEKEQVVVARIQNLEKKRMTVMKDISEVTNRKGEELKLPELIKMMENRPKEKNALTRIHDRLKTTLNGIKLINNQNRELIQSSLEMVEFEMNMLQSLRRAPETADYNKGAINTGNTFGSGTKRFDSKS